MRNALKYLGLLLFLVLARDLNGQDKHHFGEVFNCIESGDSCQQLLREVIDGYVDLEPSPAVDSLRKGARRLVRLGYFEYAHYTLQRAMEFTKDDPDLQARVNGVISTTYLFEGELDSALVYIEKCVEIFEELGDSLKWGRSYANRGQIQKELGHYAEALEDYLQAISIFKDQGSERMIARTQIEIAVLQGAKGNVEEAIFYYKKAADYYETSPDKHTYAYISLNLANDLIFSGREDTAMLLLDNAIDIFETENDTYMLMNAEAQLGRALHRIGRSPEAIDHFHKSIDLGSGENFIAQLAYNHEYLARIYRSLDQTDKALYHSKKSYQLNLELGLNEETVNSLMDLADTYEQAGQSDSALKYFKEAMNASDTLFSIEKERQLDELNTRYQSELKEEQIKAGKAEIALLAQRNRAQQNRTIALALGLIMVFLLGLVIIVRLRAKRQLAAERNRSLSAELAAKQEEEKRLKSELDHKKRELTSQALLMAEKNEMMYSFKERLQEISEQAEESAAMNQLVNKIERVENKREDWDKFMDIFEQVHPEFLLKLKKEFHDLTSNDLRLLALMRMNFSNKEIASILHISESGIKKARYRLRKKMELPSDENMHNYILKY